MTKKLIILTISCLLAFGCRREHVTKNIDTFKIDLSDTSETGFSKHYELEKYIKLESSDSALINDIRKIVFTYDKIFILTWGDAQVMIFDTNGSFLNRISRKGGGPNEYLSVVDMSVSSNGDTIGLYDKFLKKIIYYDNNGNHLKTVDLNIDLESFSSARNGNIIGYSFLNHNSPLNDTIYQLWYFDKQGKILAGKFPVSNNILGNSVGFASTFNLSSSGLYFFPFTENMIYKITEDPFEATPIIRIDFKDRTMPQDLLLMSRKEMNDAFNYAFIMVSGFVGRKNLLFNIYSYNQFKKRISILVVINQNDKKFTLIPNKNLCDEINEIPLKANMQNLYYTHDRYIAIVDAIRLQNYEFKNMQSIGYRLKLNSKVTDNPILLIYKEK